MDGAEPRWVRTTVNLDDHIIVPDLDRAAITADPDKALEDYVASLSTLPMDQSRPLWEVHVLDFPTSEAACAVALRIHHALGDGTSLVSLLLACTWSAANPRALPAMPSAQPPPPPSARRKQGRRVYGAPPRPAWSAGALALAAWVLACAVLAWNTVVDVARLSPWRCSWCATRPPCSRASSSGASGSSCAPSASTTSSSSSRLSAV